MRNDPIAAFRPSTDRGERIYAIGDVHGRFDLLQDLLKSIEEHSAGLPATQSLHVIFLGDLIDRGPHSAEVLEFVHDLQQQSDQVIVLLGNHEELLLRAAAGERGVARAWLRSGGVETLQSFGIDPGLAEEPQVLARLIKAAVPRERLEWLRRLPLSARSSDYLFCHAGVRPGVPLRKQTRTDLLWIREDFLEDPSDHGAVVVHGHSVSRDVQVRANRIGIDTGAYATGMLTALYLEGTERAVLTTGESPGVARAA